MNAIPIIIGQRAMFIPHTGFARSEMTKIDQFAEMVANGLTPTQAANRMGKDAAYGNAMMQKLRKIMGGQAR